MSSWGCGQCCGESAEEALAWLAGGDRQGLVLESHFVLALVGCPACGQRFVSVFTETIDWHGGHDPQCRQLVPVTSEEAAEVARLGEAAGDYLSQITAGGRRRLLDDWSSGGSRLRMWVDGPFWMPRYD